MDQVWSLKTSGTIVLKVTSTFERNLKVRISRIFAKSLSFQLLLLVEHIASWPTFPPFKFQHVSWNGFFWWFGCGQGNANPVESRMVSFLQGGTCWWHNCAASRGPFDIDQRYSNRSAIGKGEDVWVKMIGMIEHEIH